MDTQPRESAEAADDVGRYLQETGRIRLLSAAEEIDLARRIEVGLYATHLLALRLDGSESSELGPTRDELEWLATDGRRAHDRFIRANLRLVVSVARHYGSTGVPLLDLIQEGNTGLLRAVQKFDHARGDKFSTYATWWIRQFILRSMNVHTRSIRVPIQVHEQLTRLRRTRQFLQIELGRDPSPAELARALDLPVDRVDSLVEYERLSEPLSLDGAVGTTGSTTLADLAISDPAPGPEDVVVDDQHAAALRALVGELDPRLADIVRRRYGLAGRPPEDLARIGEHWQITAQRVRQLLNRALGQLREREAESAA